MSKVPLLKATLIKVQIYFITFHIIFLDIEENGLRLPHFKTPKPNFNNKSLTIERNNEGNIYIDNFIENLVLPKI